MSRLIDCWDDHNSSKTPHATLICLDDVFSTAFAVTLTLRLPGLINSICTGGGVTFLGLQVDALEALEVTELSKDSATSWLS